ncbi:uncharacterized protein EI90DRAFT_889212 [Cantharellus anzutake]|uniref:uncharacterized protein n=1 Tax=Cantharellus anzutake TaxID=1750568 RepID=UPI001906AFAE|nr:uncharacterized protein EI90DRAFT_889212 [Cantharellus anzutake]KAF8331838.1 hypothetical protein EI90DRAFT_889212 [Cantharellus anzutake]
MLTGLRKGRAGSTLSDYSRKRGLLPRQGSSDQATKDPSSGTGATYVFPGHVARFDTGEQFPKPGLRTYSPFRISKPGPGLGAQGAEIAQSMESGTGRSQGMGGLVCAGRSIKARDMIKTPSHTPAVTPPTSQRSVTCPFSASTIRRIGFDPLRISRERIKDNVQIVGQYPSIL